MDQSGNAGVTRELQQWQAGDRAALDRLLPLVYADLRRVASAALRRGPAPATMQTTVLVHDLMVQVLGKPPSAFQDSAHLLNASARMMRQLLIDRTRRAASDKHGGSWIRDAFTEALELPIPDGTDLAALDEALHELEKSHERMARGVELRYFVGLSVAEIANTLGITERTAHRDWLASRAWLRGRLAQAG